MSWKYRDNKAVDSFLKGLAVKAALHQYHEYVTEVAINVLRSPENRKLCPAYDHFGIDPAARILPSFGEGLRTKFYRAVRMCLPKDYMEHGILEAVKVLDKPVKFR
jgi:hypothetical protein